MKITINKTIPETIEVEFPLYIKDAAHQFKFVDEDTLIWVSDCHDYISYAIQTVNAKLYTNWMIGKPSTEAEFKEAFDKVLNAIIELKK